MRPSRISCLLIFLVLFAGCAGARRSVEKPADSAARLPHTPSVFFPERTARELFRCNERQWQELQAAEVTLVRIGTGTALRGQEQGSSNSLEAEEGAALMAALLDFDNYGEPHVCDFIPAVRVVVRASSEAYEMEVCFSCNEVKIRYPANRAGQRKSVKRGMSRTLRLAILQAARKAFPRDRTLRRL